MTDDRAAVATLARPPIDPRIRQRLIDVRREEGRRRLRFLITVAAILAVAAGGWGITRSPLLAVRRLTVNGNSHTSTAAIRAAAGLVHHRQMVDLDPGAMDRAVDALPWVDQARVHRHWPSTVVVSVTERRPVAAVSEAGGGWAAVDGTGRVLAVSAAPPAGLPRVAQSAPALAAGPPGSVLPPSATPALTVAGALPSALAAQVAAVTAGPDGQVQLALAGGATAVLGTPDSLADKLTALVTLLAKVHVGKALIDVRVPSAPVLTQTTNGQ